ncbi:hypothetical protein TUM19329_20860 [Legionella antarctica]|uniref:Uncharacterized protein n=1 Tax=Legionella antarctica TaxID=2708020 RepID=A0A6F8T4V8_9GAMM|nr:hypothetical protein [Legionella antarctica]BCA95725.1 hypothetical protein TUM19329_20860 [Legionella antarctica]
MTDSITMSKKDEYFVSIVKQDIHSFMMLGVMHNGSPKLLARVGKTNDIDPDFGKTVLMTGKAISFGTLSRITDEGLWRSKDSVAVINYQAYAINYEQFKQFLELTAEIEKKQLVNPDISAGILRVYRKNHPNEEVTDKKIMEDEAIKCYVPVSEEADNDEVRFELKALKDCNFTVSDQAKVEKISKEVQEIHISNTCRTSALNIVEVVLGFATDVSKYFFVSPKYKTLLIAGQPDKESFYIFPPPPNVFKESSDQQHRILSKLYKRMEEIPLSNPEDPKTRAKFDAIKTMYNDIAGQNTLTATQLLGSIMKYEAEKSQALFEKRSPGFFSNLFSLSSSTERLFKSIKSELEKEKASEKADEDVPTNGPNLS